MFTNLSEGTKTMLQIIFVVALLGGAVVVLLSVGVLQTSADSRLIYFEVKASGGYAIITLQAGDVSISKPTTVTVPWSKTIRIKSGTEV